MIASTKNISPAAVFWIGVTEPGLDSKSFTLP
jgi:hypothetical protein